MKRVIVLFTALCVVNFSAQEKMEKEQPIDKSQVTTKEAISLYLKCQKKPIEILDKFVGIQKVVV